MSQVAIENTATRIKESAARQLVARGYLAPVRPGLFRRTVSLSVFPITLAPSQVRCECRPDVHVEIVYADSVSVDALEACLPPAELPGLAFQTTRQWKERSAASEVVGCRHLPHDQVKRALYA